MCKLSQYITSAWYKKNPLLYLLYPLSMLYSFIAKLRANYLIAKSKEIVFGAPVIVVGNITVGGTGKTPMVIYLAQLLKSQGYKVGLVSRGYGGKKEYPMLVKEVSNPLDVGDEAVMLVRQTGCPMIVDANRVRAVRTLLANHECDIVISDDGLQHYAMPRDMEIIVIDGKRRLGNKLCLPAGPLREDASRLVHADFVVANGGISRPTEFTMLLEPVCLYNLMDEAKNWPLDKLQGQCVHAVAGIGNPHRFFSMLRKMGLEVIEHSFADHHVFVASDLNFPDQLPIVMTHKDSVKCAKFAKENMWCMEVEAVLDEVFVNRFINEVKKICGTI